MPTFVQPPQITNYLLETCEEACQTIVSFQDMVNAFNQSLNDLYAWFTSTSFPNVLYNSTENKFYYYENGAFTEIPNMPNVFLENGKLQFSDGVTVDDVPPSAIKDVLFYNGTQLDYIRRADGTTNGAAIFPYVGCMRYVPDTVTWQYHDGTAWQAIELRPVDGALVIADGKLKKYVKATDSYLTIDMPPRNGDVKSDSGFLWQYNDGLWSHFYFEGQVRAYDDNSGLEVYRSGSWEHLYTFP